MLYYEIQYPEGPKYFYHATGIGLLRQAQMAQRIWHEKEHEIVWLKHRLSYKRTTPIDMKEFFWVKLTAVNFDERKLK
jgi:hypothetical protein